MSKLHQESIVLEAATTNTTMVPISLFNPSCWKDRLNVLLIVLLALSPFISLLWCFILLMAIGHSTFDLIWNTHFKVRYCGEKVSFLGERNRKNEGMWAVYCVWHAIPKASDFKQTLFHFYLTILSQKFKQASVILLSIFFEHFLKKLTINW